MGTGFPVGTRSSAAGDTMIGWDEGHGQTDRKTRQTCSRIGCLKIRKTLAHHGCLRIPSFEQRASLKEQRDTEKAMNDTFILEVSPLKTFNLRFPALGRLVCKWHRLKNPGLWIFDGKFLIIKASLHEYCSCPITYLRYGLRKQKGNPCFKQ